MKLKPCLLFMAFLFVSVNAWSAVEPGRAWAPVSLAAPKEVELGGPVGAAIRRGVERLSQPPYTADWLLADVSFKVNRIFTNYSGDVSGRFLELAALTSPVGQLSPATLQPVVSEIARYQKADGHFGLEMDFTRPMQKLSPPIPMLWGNARLLVGLVAAARECHDTNLLAAARRLGDFYVASAEVFCSPTREGELRATGTGGDGYTCCYFPAIEGLALLYRATRDERYLQQARRMAEWFKTFDALPTDHSHGNLCAWRGILELYDLTSQRAYLDRALAKWENAMRNGYVWPIGGVGEHWYLFHNGDEGCSESDWLRFNLELWRFTGETRFLEVAERLLHNQYPANQCANGGYGWRQFDGEAAGPIGTRGAPEEWNFCCSFHGPLGLHFLKSYVVAGSERGLFLNFPLDLAATIHSGGRDWRVQVRTQPRQEDQPREFEVELAPAGASKVVRTTLWLRKPEWAANATVAGPSGKALPFTLEHGYMRCEREFKAGERLRVTFTAGLRIEGRRFQQVSLEPGRISRLRDVALLDGPEVLFAAPTPALGRMVLLAKVDSAGQLSLWGSPGGGYATVPLPGLEAGAEQITSALESARPIALRPESAQPSRRRSAFMHDLVVVPDGTLPAATLARFAARAPQSADGLAGPFFGEHLERNPEAWVASAGWQFASNSLHVTGGDIGLLDGEGYADYRFEFDLQLPAAGQGLAGWVVRAAGPGDCLMFQLQSADSTYSAPQYKTRPNTLRPHVRRNGEWTIADPVSLPKEVRRGENHRMAVECRGAQVTVLLDGEKIFSQENGGYRTGTVGFRAAGASEQGLFRNISLRKL